MPTDAISPSVDQLTEDGLIPPMCAIFRRFLKQQGLKFTTERALILEAVLNKEGVFEAEELLEEMRTARQRVSKATIYRTLKHLLEAKIITEVLIDANKAHYRLSFGREPQGHLVCAETGRVIEFPASDLLAMRDRVCAEHGFKPLSHRFVVYGLSPEGQQARDTAEAAADDSDADTDAIADPETNSQID